MESYIFITKEGYTFQPRSEALEPDIEDCQVLGFANGVNPQHAFQNLIKENSFLLGTTFDEVISIELKYLDFCKHKSYFHLDDCKANMS